MLLGFRRVADNSATAAECVAAAPGSIALGCSQCRFGEHAVGAGIPSMGHSENRSDRAETSAVAHVARPDYLCLHMTYILLRAIGSGLDQSIENHRHCQNSTLYGECDWNRPTSRMDLAGLVAIDCSLTSRRRSVAGQS